ncbi:DUF1269 domain-containing protein [Actinomyces capricornis]|uniref:DUF1269 domain-containing protein n=1 Tax=Actinomyces capricornis TaxID=2755559 RepID=A0ABN6K3J3_9ACTO|nr:DUF1269 domain-containing protein [Actinomyces capricornis]BDA64172.1 hypothetical protein MANAM107_10060 [Actinomyces capricornis]
MTAHIFAIATFPESSKAYEALSELRQAAGEDRIGIDAAVIAKRDTNGHLSFAEGEDNVIGGGAVTGGLVGTLIGVLGGPLGMLVGWGAGALVGSYSDADRADHVDTALGEISQHLPAGATAIVAEVEEVTPEVLDTIVTSRGGAVLRRDAEEVVDELEAAEAAAETADREASRILREERKAERKQKWEDRVEALREKFHHKKDD